MFIIESMGKINISIDLLIHKHIYIYIYMITKAMVFVYPNNYTL